MANQQIETIKNVLMHFMSFLLTVFHKFGFSCQKYYCILQNKQLIHHQNIHTEGQSQPLLTKLMIKSSYITIYIEI